MRVRANYIIISFRFHYLLVHLKFPNLYEKADELFGEVHEIKSRSAKGESGDLLCIDSLGRLLTFS